MKNKYFNICFLFFIFINNLFAISSDTNLITGKMVILIFQIGIIIIVSWLGGYIFRKLKIPSVLGEIIAGILIGPYCLGGISFFGFPCGLFPIDLNNNFPISPELYSFATIASIILLFISGLETDLKTFIRYSFVGSIIGIFGVLISFIFGDIFGIIFAKYVLNQNLSFFNIMPMFLGVISTATSVGITAKILSEKHKMDSPEGVTILTSAVVDDVIGIILLSVMIRILKSGHIEWKNIFNIGIRSFLIWLIFVVLGIIFSNYIAKFLKFFKDKITITIISIALALILAGIFEKYGLSMIVGAYIMGLSISKTDISLTIQENIDTIQKFFIPIFFCVMGMMLDISQLMSFKVIFFGMIFLIFAVLGKLIGCSLPAYFCNFNKYGALRIGAGMIPRGEVALIVVSIGLANGILTQDIFGVVIIMTFLTIFITPFFLSKVFDLPYKGLKNDKILKNINISEIIYKLPNNSIEEYLILKILQEFDKEGFFVHNLSRNDEKIYRFYKNEIVISLKIEIYDIKNDLFIFEVNDRYRSFVNTIFYESISEMEGIIKNIQNIEIKDKIIKNMFQSNNKIVSNKNIIEKILKPKFVSIDLNGNNKYEILSELVNILVLSGQIQKEIRINILQELVEREKVMSTGMQNGFALPHIRTNFVKKLCIVIGLNKKGVNFNSIDNKLSKLFIMIISPKDLNNYLNILADITEFFTNIDIQKLFLSKTNEDFYKNILNSKKL